MLKGGQVRIAERQAVQFRQDAGLSGTEPLNIKSLLLKLKVVTLFRPLSDEFSGMSLKDNSDHRFMLINSNQPKGRQHFTIAHELFHLFIEISPKPHKCMAEDGVKNSIEQQADMFASILLMPEDGINQMLPKTELENSDVSLASIIMLEHYFSVSRAALLNRLVNLKLITNQQKDFFKTLPVIQTAQEYGYDTSLYKSGNQNLVIGDFGEKARKLFDMDKISEGHYIELMNKIEFNGNKQD